MDERIPGTAGQLCCCDTDLGTVKLLYDNKALDGTRGDVDDGVLMLKFDRATAAGWFEGLHDEEVELTVLSEVSDIEFQQAPPYVLQILHGLCEGGHRQTMPFWSDSGRFVQSPSEMGAARSGGK